MAEPVIAQKSPIPVEVEAGKDYWWCACGQSKRQPFCDGSHKGTEFTPRKWTAEATGRKLDDVAVWGRHGVTGERDASSIGFSVIRGGDIVGDHTVLFAGTGERIEITHRSSSRATYAQGSLRAVRYLASQPSGLFDMFDVLNLR